MLRQVVILAAGLGSRLGRPHPKPLTALADGRSILDQQLDNLREVWGTDIQVIVVVGYKRDMIMEAHQDVLYAYNECFDTTNTSKSLLRGLRLAAPDGVLWLNGDVVFHPDLLRRVSPLVAEQQSFVCVNTTPVGEEEVAYTTDDAGHVTGLRKGLASAQGEAIGINFVAGQDRHTLIGALEACADSDYFERAIELATDAGSLSMKAADISGLHAVEVDFPDDLRRANASLAPAVTATGRREMSHPEPPEVPA